MHIAADTASDLHDHREEFKIHKLSVESQLSSILNTIQLLSLARPPHSSTQNDEINEENIQQHLNNLRNPTFTHSHSQNSNPNLTSLPTRQDTEEETH